MPAATAKVELAKGELARCRQGELASASQQRGPEREMRWASNRHHPGCPGGPAVKRGGVFPTPEF